MNSVTEDFFKLNHRIFNFYINTSKNKNLNNENKIIITSMTNNFKGNNLYIANID